MRTWMIKPQGIPTTFKFRGSDSSVTNFCRGLAVALNCEVTGRYRTHRNVGHGKWLVGTGINEMPLRDLQFVYDKGAIRA